MGWSIEFQDALNSLADILKCKHGYDVRLGKCVDPQVATEEIDGTTGTKLKELVGHVSGMENLDDSVWSKLGKALKANQSTPAVFSGAIVPFFEMHPLKLGFPMTSGAFSLINKKLSKTKYDATTLLDIWSRANLIDQIDLPCAQAIKGQVRMTNKDKSFCKDNHGNTTIQVWIYSPEFVETAGKILKQVAKFKIS